MIDNFALAVSHGLLLLAAWRLIWRADLEDDSAPASAPRAFWPLRRSDEERPVA
ncbi:MAG: hypothetical protein M3177_02030 [Pseudomonadota bacterium]|nr:hypothetical protein [Pseudomonadota bacterium]